MLVSLVAIISVLGAWPILAVVRERGFEGVTFAVVVALAFAMVFMGSVNAVMCFAPDVATRPFRLVSRVVVAALYGLAILGATFHLTHGFWANHVSSEVTQAEVVVEDTAETEGLADSELGRTYLEDLIECALDELRDDQVASHAFPGDLVADTVDPELVIAILFAEHTSHRDLLAGTAVTRVLESFGRRGPEAFKTAASPVGAYGLAQMMDQTYESLDVAYPEARLHTDFHIGRENHRNAVKAMFLHLDNEMAHLSPAARSRVRTDEWQRRALVAGYNTGIATVSTAIRDCDTEWRSETCAKLPPETQEYLEKYLLISEELGLKG
ncbi:TPA: hypothetical protein DEA21_02125 [Candidatus Uhrbacteria bacterium]|nr:hypothetical protein [Candidatus Uhrbacteria bacterium]HCU31188.1 hypothetical protein [Candidatus Uhrbacteria bacterium]